MAKNKFLVERIEHLEAVAEENEVLRGQLQELAENLNVGAEKVEALEEATRSLKMRLDDLTEQHEELVLSIHGNAKKEKPYTWEDEDEDPGENRTYLDEDEDEDSDEIADEDSDEDEPEHYIIVNPCKPGTKGFTTYFQGLRLGEERWTRNMDSAKRYYDEAEAEAQRKRLLKKNGKRLELQPGYGD